MSETRKKPKVSVVFATYNRSASAARLLQQLAVQDMPSEDFEVIVIDDGSKEDPTEVLRAVPMPGVCIIKRQANSGAAAARDNGIRTASGDIIVIVDDDMQIDVGFLSAHVQYHALGPRRVVFGHIKPDDTLEMPLFSRYHSAMLARLVDAIRSGKVKLRGTQLCTGNVSFRRSDYLQVGGFDRDFRQSEDAELGVRLEKAGCELVFGEDAVTLHASDHESQELWIRRALRYGAFDLKISRKHSDVAWTHPCRFFYIVSPLSRPLLLTLPIIPRVGSAAARLTMGSAEIVARLGAERLGIAGATLAYGLFYYTGMRQESGSITAHLREFLRYHDLRKREFDSPAQPKP